MNRVAPHSLVARCAACLVALAATTAASPPGNSVTAPTTAAATTTAPQRSPTAILAHGIKQLSNEAAKSMADGVLARAARTFAKDCGESLPSPLVLDRLGKPIHNDAFTDAYIRWQLTGFEIPDFAMTDLAFDRLLRTLPAMLPSPRANAGLIEALNRATQVGRLAPAQQEEANARLNALASQASAAEALNTPALEFRAWLIEHCDPWRPDRAIALAMERAASLAAAGWPNEQAKRQVDAMIEKSARQREFTAEQRREVMQRAASLATTGHMFVASAGVSGDALSVEFGVTGIFDFDVRRWQKALDDE
jgi:hypothetical protein